MATLCAGPVNTTLGASISENLCNVGVDWQDQLFTDFQFLYSTLNGAMPRVTEGMKQWQADLKGAFHNAMAARDAILDGAVSDANQAIDNILVVPEMPASGS